MDENAMEYVPLDTPSEVTEPVEVTPASTFEPDAPTPVTAEQQPVQPTPPAPQPEQPATPPPPPVPPPPQQPLRLNLWHLSLSILLLLHLSTK